MAGHLADVSSFAGFFMRGSVRLSPKHRTKRVLVHVILNTGSVFLIGRRKRVRFRLFAIVGAKLGANHCGLIPQIVYCDRG
jgi:hypothetical protein